MNTAQHEGSPKRDGINKSKVDKLTCATGCRNVTNCYLQISQRQLHSHLNMIQAWRSSPEHQSLAEFRLKLCEQADRNGICQVRHPSSDSALQPITKLPVQASQPWIPLAQYRCHTAKSTSDAKSDRHGRLQAISENAWRIRLRWGLLPEQLD